MRVLKKATFRAIHLEKMTHLKVGNTVEKGDLIGRMGNTGSTSSGAHIHGDLIPGWADIMWNMPQCKEKLTPELIEQLAYFFDWDLFKTEIFITSYVGDPEYLKERNKFHTGFDAVPENRHREPGKNFDIYWPRTPKGVVMAEGYSKGTGNYILIGFEYYGEV